MGGPREGEVPPTSPQMLQKSFLPSHGKLYESRSGKLELNATRRGRQASCLSDAGPSGIFAILPQRSRHMQLVITNHAIALRPSQPICCACTASKKQTAALGHDVLMLNARAPPCHALSPVGFLLNTEFPRNKPEDTAS
jgi:hypothetical protein